jgi:hypothetical protein
MSGIRGWRRGVSAGGRWRGGRAASTAAADAGGRPPPASLWVMADSWRVRLRLPAVDDLQVAAGSESPADARKRWFVQCALEVSHGGEPVDADTLPGPVQHRLAAAAASAVRYDIKAAGGSGGGSASGGSGGGGSGGGGSASGGSGGGGYAAGCGAGRADDGVRLSGCGSPR